MDLSPEHHDKDQSLVPWQSIVDGPSWLRYRANKREIIIQPFDVRESRLLSRLHAESIVSMMNAGGGGGGGGSISSVGDGDGDGDQVTNSTKKRSRTNSFSEAVVAADDDDVSMMKSNNNTELTHTPPIISSGGIGTTGSATGSASGGGRHHVIRSKATKSKYMEVPLYIKVVELMEQIGKKIIGVDVNHLVLYIIALTPGQSIKDIDRDDLYSCKPVTLLSSPQQQQGGGGGEQQQQLLLETTLNDVILEQKINSRLSTKYAIFYKVLPYALYDLQSKVVFKRTKRFTDFVIVDERLRYWRRLYLGSLFWMD